MRKILWLPLKIPLSPDKGFKLKDYPTTVIDAKQNTRPDPEKGMTVETLAPVIAQKPLLSRKRPDAYFAH
jgi:hypothetical protein